MRRPAGGTRDIAVLSPGLYPVRRFRKIMAPSTSGSIDSLRRHSNLLTLTLDRQVYLNETCGVRPYTRYSNVSDQ